MNSLQVIIKPIITEKSMAFAGNGKFSFIVSRDASKNDIKRAVEDIFSVKVTDIAVTTVKGKTKRIGKRREEVIAPPIKKAMVTVKKGQKIGIFEAGS